MTTEDVVRLGWEAGIFCFMGPTDRPVEALTRFAKLVAASAKADEREACAQLAEQWVHGEDCVRVIRARGQND